MGHAWRAPQAAYVRRFFISTHAVARLRDRLKDAANTTHRDHVDLGNRIDEAVFVAIQAGHVEGQLYKGQPFKLVDLRQTLHDDLFAAVCANREPHPKEAVVTLLTHAMVRQAHRTSRWASASLGTLADLIDPMKLLKFKSIYVPSEAKPTPPCLITYIGARDKSQHLAHCDLKQAASRVAELRSDPDIYSPSIELWKRWRT